MLPLQASNQVKGLPPQAELVRIKSTVDTNINQWISAAKRENKSRFCDIDGFSFLITPKGKVYADLGLIGGGSYKFSHKILKVADKTSFSVNKMNQLKVVSLARADTIADANARAELEQELAYHQKFKQERKQAKKHGKSNPYPNICIGSRIETADGMIGIKSKLMSGGNLDKFIAEKGYFKQADKLDQVRLGTHAIGFAKGLQQLHSHGIVHRDIKPDNLVLSEDKGHIIDFGKAIRKNSQFQSTPLPFMFFSPEAIESIANGRTDGVNTAANDIYALGITLYLMASKRTQSQWASHYNMNNVPQQTNQDRAQGFLKLRGNSKDWTDYSDIPHTLRSLIKKMTSFNPKDRPNAGQVAEELESLVAKKKLKP